MSAALGLGVRVFVGWVPDDDVNPGAFFDGRLRRGTITDGPFLPGVYWDAYTGERTTIPPGPPHWNVALDGGGAIGACESLLTPIDDGDGERQDARQDDEVTA